MENKNTEEIKKGMHQAKKDMVTSMMITRACIKKLEDNIQKIDNLLVKLQV